MSNQDVEAQKADTTSPEGTDAAAWTKGAAGKATIVSTLLVAISALIVGSIALSRTSSSSTPQSQQNLGIGTAHHGGKGITTNTEKTKQSGDDVESKEDTTATSGTFDAVSSAGILKCGVVPVIGFADNSTGTWVGMDADLCRAVAAGVGADVEFVPTTFPDRWMVAGGTHDVASGSVRLAGYTGPYEIGVNTFSKDPLAIMTREDDPSFSDFCFWVLQATIFAEEEEITQMTAADTMPLINLYGDLFTRMLQNAVQAVGNTGELYERNIERLVPRAGLNQLNDAGGPQLYSLPGITSNSWVG